MGHGTRIASRFAFLALIGSLAIADVFVMKDGRRIEGTLVKEEQGVLTVQTGVGELKLSRSDVVEIVAKKTASQEFDERMKKASTAEDFFQAGEYARTNKLKRESQKAWKKAIEIDPNHVGARTALGFVLYKGAWLTPEERDAKIVAEETAEMTARGLVRYKDRWVTPEDKQRLEQGMVQVDGKWISFAESQHRLGLEDFEGAWLPRPVALARRDLALVQPLAVVPLEFTLGADAMVAGPFPKPFLESISKQLDVARSWFDGAWRSPSGLALFGGRMAEIYAFGHDSAPYTATVAHFGSLTTTVPPGWAESVAESHGFFWIDPYPLSSARQWNRGEEDLVGHCLHHWGHLLVGRLGYDGRLLPAWYEEAVACRAEYAGHRRNAVLCRGSLIFVPTGTRAKTTVATLDSARFRDGDWRTYLKAAFEQQAVPKFDRLWELEFANLELVDIAAGMAILEWLEKQKDGQGLRAFHDELRRGAPSSPQRVIPEAQQRRVIYDRAFQAGAGLNWHDADQAWRKWFLAGG